MRRSRRGRDAHLTEFLPVLPKLRTDHDPEGGMAGSKGRPQSMMESYCSQLGSLLGLDMAKQQAEAAAILARQDMLEARAADRAKSNFLANMSHELRTPLNAIIGFAEIIKNDGGDTRDKYPRYAEYIYDSGRLLLDIINGLLDLARIEAGKLALEEEWMPLIDIARSALQTIQPIAEKKSIDISCDAGPTPLAVHIDPTKFKQILLNLLTNSVKFTPPAGKVVIAAEREEAGDLMIAIHDTGVGITAEHLQKVLEPFQQVHDPLTRHNDGIGLGLPIAKALMGLHGGELRLTSEAGIGTTAWLRLPADRVRLGAAAPCHNVA
jgi:signal transduction histidine kinase